MWLSLCSYYRQFSKSRFHKPRNNLEFWFRWILGNFSVDFWVSSASVLLFDMLACSPSLLQDQRAVAIYFNQYTPLELHLCWKDTSVGVLFKKSWPWPFTSVVCGIIDVDFDYVVRLYHNSWLKLCTISLSITVSSFLENKATS